MRFRVRQRAVGEVLSSYDFRRRGEDACAERISDHLRFPTCRLSKVERIGAEVNSVRPYDGSSAISDSNPLEEPLITKFLKHASAIDYFGEVCHYHPTIFKFDDDASRRQSYHPDDSL